MNLKYKSFYWCLGTTSFRTRNFNKRIELQLSLLRDFWSLDENRDKEWSERNGIQVAYYEFLKKSDFIWGDAPNKSKDAREKTSGLVSLGLIYDNRRLTEAGEELLRISESNDFSVDNVLGVPADSFIYLKQLLKSTVSFDDIEVRPFVVMVYMLVRLKYLSYSEFKYLLPLAIDRNTTLEVIEKIKLLREGKTSIDEIVFSRIMERENYREALDFFLTEPVVTEEVIQTVGINRKSRKYDKAYYPLYCALFDLCVSKDVGAVSDVLESLKNINNTGTLWQQYLFDTSAQSAIKKEPLKHFRSDLFIGVKNEEEFRCAFFKVLHVIKVKRNLSDYFDLNRRYMKTTDIILFEDNNVTLDIIPKNYFVSIAKQLLGIAFSSSDVLWKNCALDEIAPFLLPDEDIILEGINSEFSLKLKSLQEASSILERQRYIRFNHLVNSRFTDENIIAILDFISDRNDKEVQKMVTDNADVPTIFEYILGILWYKISDCHGKILDYMKLSLDSDLLPKTHASGGGADIVYEYEECNEYPAHSLLLEATLTDKDNQRRMEMEPVSRHLGNYILRTQNLDAYCVFVTNKLNVNVVSDFRGRKYIPYYDTLNPDNFIEGMKIIPLEIEDLSTILKRKLRYDDLYGIFETAFQSKVVSYKWYEDYITTFLKKI